MEYDTYRNPAGPLSAGAQVLYGAISNFVTGLAGVPTDVFVDFLSAGRSLGQPRSDLDQLCKWRKRRPDRDEEYESGEEDERSKSTEVSLGDVQVNETAPTRSHFSEIAHFGGRVSKKFINLVMWLPTDLTLSLSKGFHNLPRLYHDPMVKSTPKVIGIQSGFRAAGQVYAPTISIMSPSC